MSNLHVGISRLTTLHGQLRMTSPEETIEIKAGDMLNFVETVIELSAAHQDFEEATKARINEIEAKAEGRSPLLKGSPLK